MAPRALAVGVLLLGLAACSELPMDTASGAVEPTTEVAADSEASTRPALTPDERAARRAEWRSLAESRARVARRTYFFDECAIDEYSYRKVLRTRLEPGAEIPPPSEECRQFWALSRDYRLEHDCLQPEKPERCAEYLAMKARLGL